jgi:NitT/TauT family transport system substrate-binding protein
MPIPRRAILAAPLAAPLIARAQPRQVKMLLNTGLSGPQGFLFLAADALAAQGIALAFTPGSGANNTAPRMLPEGFDMGFGDINALADMIARGTSPAPLAVFSVFPATPNAIAVRADGPVQAPADLAGKSMISHATDTALHTFPAYARAAGIDAAAVKVTTSPAAMSEFVTRVMAREFDGAFGWVNTLRFSARLARIEPEGLRFLRFRDVAPDLHGGFLMVARPFAEANPEMLRAILLAARAGIARARAEPDAAMAALAHRLPNADLAVHKERMLGTLQFEMDHPDVAANGVGRANQARLGASFNQLAAALAWPKAPAVGEVYSTAFLPS